MAYHSKTALNLAKNRQITVLCAAIGFRGRTGAGETGVILLYLSYHKHPHCMNVPKFGSILLIVMYLVPLAGKSQQADSTVTGFLPALGYSSDVGFVAGGLGSRYYYQEGYDPYRVSVQVAALLSTRGLFSLLLQTDQTDTFGLGFRTVSRISAALVRESTWFGTGNQTTFDLDLWETGYYFFESVVTEHELRLRRRLWDSSNGQDAYLDLQYLSLIRSSHPRSSGSFNLFNEQQPLNGQKNSWTWIMGLGLHWESRDNEIAPTRGNTAVLDIMAGPGLASDHAMWQAGLLLTHYTTRTILLPVTLALRTGYIHTGGDVPFYMYPELGGEETVRGYAQDRFRGDAVFHYTTELRTWLVQIPARGFRLGGQLFMDGGRVYVGDEVYRDFLSEHRQSFGFGAAMSLFTYDFLVRADLGFSDELTRLYLGIGYTF